MTFEDDGGLVFYVSLNIILNHIEMTLFVLRFYGPVNPMGSCQAQSICLITLLLGRLSSLSS